MTITPADILAMSDVIASLTEASDDLTLDDAAALKQALGQHATALKTCQGLIDTRILKLLDGAPAADTTSGAIKKTASTKWTPNHGRIRSIVQSRALVDEDGSRLALPEDAVEQAVDMMYKMFVGPSDMPKAAALEELRLRKSDVADSSTGTVKVTLG